MVSLSHYTNIPMCVNCATDEPTSSSFDATDGRHERHGGNKTMRYGVNKAMYLRELLLPIVRWVGVSMY